MTTNKRIISMILAALLAASTLASCADDKQTESKETQGGAVTTAPVTKEEDTRVYPTHLPDLTFENYDFNMAHWEISGWTMIPDIDAEGENADLVNDAVYKRNASIEEKYAIKINGTYLAHDVILNTYKQMVNTADNTYDVMFVRSHEAPTTVQGGYTLDLFQLNYIDWEMPWWDQQAVAEFSIANRLFMVESDITLMDKGATGCIYFNKAVAENWKVEDLYQLVLDDKWTWAKMQEIAKGVRDDLNGDSAMTVEDDLWGLSAGDDATYLMLHAANGRYASKDDDDIPVIEFGTERTLEVAQAVLDMMNDDTYFGYGGSLEDFTEGRRLMIMDLIKKSSEMREFEDYGIIPLPKYDETQENYGASVSIHHSAVLTVPKTIPEESYDRTGVILEALAAESKYTVLNTYYDTVLKVKNTRDEQSVAMLDIIFNNRVFDLGEFYQFGNFNVEYLRAMGRGHRDVVSLFERFQKPVQKAIDTLVKNIDKYE